MSKNIFCSKYVSYNGVMFDVEANYDPEVPVEFLEVIGIGVYGQFRRITVWVSQQSHENIFEDRTQWNLIHNQTIQGNFANMTCLDFNNPVQLQRPGRKQGFYVHVPHMNGAIAYDDQRGVSTFENSYITVHPGLSHLSSTPFHVQGNRNWLWRPNRDFVGRLILRVKLTLWKPVKQNFNNFGPIFQRIVFTTLLALKRSAKTIVFFFYLSFYSA